MKLSEDMKVKITLVIFVFSIVRLFLFFDSPDAVGNFKRDQKNMIQDSVSIYEYIVAKPLELSPPTEQDPIEKNISTSAQSPSDEIKNPTILISTPSEENPEFVVTEESPQKIETIVDRKEDTSVDRTAAVKNENENKPQNLTLPSEQTLLPKPVANVEVSPTFRKKFLSLLSCNSYQNTADIHPVIWKLMVKKSGQKKYVTRKPTALTNVSKEVFGREECWTKIWSLNPEISNPFHVPESTAIFFYEK